MTRVDPAAGLDTGPAPTHRPLLHRRFAARSVWSAVLTVVVGGMALLAAAPLFAVLWLLIRRGAGAFRPEMLWQLPPSGLAAAGTGGFGNAILGTLYMVLVAAAVAVPVGVLAAVHLAAARRGSRLAEAIRFAAKVLTGMPSILAGIFVFSLVVLTTGTVSAYAGGAALAVLMVPIVTLTAEQAIRAVPAKMQEAAVGMGATPTQVTLRVTLPTAAPSILTGVMLAVARAAGETAPLLFTAKFSQYYLRIDHLEETASLAVLIYNFSGSPYENQIEMAWTASLVLVLFVLAFNLGGQWLASRNELGARR